MRRRHILSPRPGPVFVPPAYNKSAIAGALFHSVGEICNKGAGPGSVPSALP